MQPPSEQHFDRERLLNRVSTLKMWRRHGRLAPHKPLLLLYALGKFARGDKLLNFEDIDRDLAELLNRFGPSARSVHPEYPFWRLQNDGLWKVHADGPMTPRKSNGDPKKSELRRARARGQFTAELRDLFDQDPDAIHEVAQALLEQNFPEARRKEIAVAVGLPFPR